MALPQQSKELPHQSQIDRNIFIVIFFQVQRKAFFLIATIFLKKMENLVHKPLRSNLTLLRKGLHIY